MEIRELNNWVEFKEVVDEIRRTYGYYDRDNLVLFRGQPDLSLKTTLERKTTAEFTQFDFLRFAMKTVYEVESYTDKKWGIPNFSKLKKEIDNEQKQAWHKVHFPDSCYKYLVHLRHHGYPSPLLDWTTSPYVAAYFAMCESPQQKYELIEGKCESIQHDKVAVYVYIKHVVNIESLYNPIITVLSSHVSTHKRHFNQKAWYTVASRWSEKSSIHTFCSHHEIFDRIQKSYDPPQDLLIKITIPTNDRGKVLKELDNDYNINHFTLFQTEDSLIKTLGIKEFDIGDL